jgi:hypothetical protein
MIRSILFGFGALLLIIWMTVTIQHISREQPWLHIFLGLGVLLIAIGCVLHMKVTHRIGEIEEDKSRGESREHFR